MIIGITGKKQSGKDTIANYLVNKYNFEKISFADPLKSACRELFLFDDDQLYGDKKEEIDEFFNVTPRKTMQFIGTEVFRNYINNLLPDIKDNFWVCLMEKQIMNNKNLIVIPDVRFQNELDLIKKYNGVIIKVDKISNIIDDHISESNNVENVDHVIDNNNTKEKLYENIDVILNNYKTNSKNKKCDKMNYLYVMVCNFWIAYVIVQFIVVITHYL